MDQLVHVYTYVLVYATLITVYYAKICVLFTEFHWMTKTVRIHERDYLRVKVKVIILYKSLVFTLDQLQPMSLVRSAKVWLSKLFLTQIRVRRAKLYQNLWATLIHLIHHISLGSPCDLFYTLLDCIQGFQSYIFHIILLHTSNYCNFTHSAISATHKFRMPSLLICTF